VTEHGDGLLRALGRVEPPRPAVLEAAREALWSAVAAEMLATRPPGDSRRGKAAGPEHERRHRDGPGS
jgi:hypothetical protein